MSVSKSADHHVRILIDKIMREDDRSINSPIVIDVDHLSKSSIKLIQDLEPEKFQKIKPYLINTADSPVLLPLKSSITNLSYCIYEIDDKVIIGENPELKDKDNVVLIPKDRLLSIDNSINISSDESFKAMGYDVQQEFIDAFNMFSVLVSFMTEFSVSKKDYCVQDNNVYINPSKVDSFNKKFQKYYSKSVIESSIDTLQRYVDLLNIERSENNDELLIDPETIVPWSFRRSPSYIGTIPTTVKSDEPNTVFVELNKYPINTVMKNRLIKEKSKTPDITLRLRDYNIKSTLNLILNKVIEEIQCLKRQLVSVKGFGIEIVYSNDTVSKYILKYNNKTMCYIHVDDQPEFMNDFDNLLLLQNPFGVNMKK